MVLICHIFFLKPALMNAKEGSSASESFLTAAKARQAENEEIQESATQPREDKITLNTDKHSYTVQNSDKKNSTLNIGGNRSNKPQVGDTVIDVQPEVLGASEIQNNESKMKSTPDIDLGSWTPHSAVISKLVKVSEVQPEITGGCKAQARVMASHHTSSYPAALDCEHIHLQHCFPPALHSVSEPQPPPYIQPPPHPHAEPQNKPETTVSSSSYTLKPAQVLWASSNSGSSTSAAATDVIQRLQCSRLEQTSTNGISTGAYSSPIYNQKLSQPSPSRQGTVSGI